MARDPLGHVTGNAAPQGCRCPCCLELLGCSRYRTRTAATPQGTAPCRTASPAQPCSVGTHNLQRTALQLSLLPVCPELFLECFGDHGAFSTTTVTLPRTADMEPGAARHRPSSSPVLLAHQESSWLIPVPQTRSLGHPRSPAPPWDGLVRIRVVLRAVLGSS